MGTGVTVVREQVPHGGLRLTIEGPSAMNTLGAETLTALDDALVDAVGDAGVRAVVIRGAGQRAFSAGADLKELRDLPAMEAQRLLRFGQRVLRRVETLGKPVVAQVDGYALGGGFELCLACSLTVASDRSRFALPEAGLGLIPGYGGTQRLARSIGKQRALRVMLLGEMLHAEQAHALGVLPFEPVPPAELDAAVATILETLATKSPFAMATILKATDMAASTPLATALEHESDLAFAARESEDGVIGVNAFLDKATPRYPGLSADVRGRR